MYLVSWRFWEKTGILWEAGYPTVTATERRTTLRLQLEQFCISHIAKISDRLYCRH